MEKIGLEAVLEDANFQAGLKRFNSGIDEMSSKADRGASAISRIGSIAQGAVVAGFTAATAAATAFVAISKHGLDVTLEWAEGLDKLGDQFGMDGPEAAKWATAMQHVGLSIEEGAQGLNFFTRGLAETTKTSAKGVVTLTPFGESLKKLGVNAYDAKGKLKTFDQIMPEIMDKFQKLPAGVNASALAMDLFGARGGTKFLDFLRQGSKGLEDARKLAEEFGLEIEDDGVQAAEEFGFAMNDLNLELKGLWNTIGLEVLPFARKFVDLVKDKLIPVLVQWARDYMPRIIARLHEFGAFLQRDVLPYLTDLAGRVGKVIDAFQKGGLSGAIDEFGRQLQQAFKGFDLANLLGDVGGKIASALAANWPAIQAELSKWSTRFWTWLTGENGKGGALQAVGEQLGKVANAIRLWLSNPKNVDPIFDAVRGWANMFWLWITDPQSGVLVTVARNMEKLVKALDDWAQSPDTVEQMQAIGARLANDILDGIGRLFDNPGESENLLTRLARSIWNAVQSLASFFANIGANIGSGIVKGILSRFLDGATAQYLANGFRSLLYQWLAILLAPGGALPEIGRRIAQGLMDSISANFKMPQLLPSSTGGGSSGMGTTTSGGAQTLLNATLAQLTSTFQSLKLATIPQYQAGGFVPATGPAILHAGEYVLPARPSRTLLQTLNFSHTWNGAATAFDRHEIERVAEDAAYRGIRRVMDL